MNDQREFFRFFGKRKESVNNIESIMEHSINGLNNIDSNSIPSTSSSSSSTNNAVLSSSSLENSSNNNNNIIFAYNFNNNTNNSQRFHVHRLTVRRSHMGSMRNRTAEPHRNYLRHFYSRRNLNQSNSSGGDSTATAEPATTPATSAAPLRITANWRISSIDNANASPLQMTTVSDSSETNVVAMSYSSASSSSSSSQSPSQSTNSTVTTNASTNGIETIPNVFEILPEDILSNLHCIHSGFTKQDINRHTISYEYKPKKRKRMKLNNDGQCSSNQEQNNESDMCSICLDRFSVNIHVRRLPCLHVFHIKCIDKWLKNNKKCPICRISIAIDYDKIISSLNSGVSIEQCLNQQQETSFQTLYTATNLVRIIADIQQLLYETPPENNNDSNNGIMRLSDVLNHSSSYNNNNNNNNNNNQSTASANNNNDSDTVNNTNNNN